MKRLLIVGAGGFGREVASYAMDFPLAGRDWELGGFLDSNPRALDGFPCTYAILGSPLTFPLSTDDVLICALGDPAIKLRLAAALKSRSAQFITFVHPTVTIGFGCRIGEGCIFAPHSMMSTNVQVGAFVTVNCYSGLGHDSALGDGCTLSAHCDVTGGASLGSGVFLGSHACIMPRARVGDYATVGAGSVVLRRVEAYSSVMGVPAKKIFTRKPL